MQMRDLEKIKEGKIEEKIEGACEKALEMAQKLLNLGTPLEVVMQASELPLDVVEDLKMG